MFTDQKEKWAAEARLCKPALRHVSLRPQRLVEIERNESVFQRWSAEPCRPAKDMASVVLHSGDEIVLDFGEHAVGYLTLFFARIGTAHTPARLRVLPAEVPSELRDSYEEYPGIFPRGWLADCHVTLAPDVDEVRIPRRHALQYLAVRVEDDGGSTLSLTDVKLDSVSAVAPENTGAESLVLPPRAAALDAAARRTLRNCMQDVFEDGPKRDRRLWLGDLRLQAQVNYATFHDYALVKRCLFLLASVVHPDGRVPACVYLNPEPHAGNEFIPDYAFLFGPTLRDYCQASGDWETGRTLYPVARRQLELGLGWLNDRSIFQDPGELWLFVDWCESLDRQAAEHATLAYALRETAALADQLGERNDAAWMRSGWRTLALSAKAHLFDVPSGLFVSGKDRQISWASQVWMVLAGIVDASEGANLLRRATVLPEILQPGCPYLRHHQVEAFLACGLETEAAEQIERVWGTMLDCGASTFWEVFADGDDFASPYRSHLFNSYCHAWSCTPALWLRKTPNLLRKHLAGCSLFCASLSVVMF